MTAAMEEVHLLSSEVDFDYEFDAMRYFDFAREETLTEVREAEFWFETAGSYPPSSFESKVAFNKDIFADTVNTLPKSKYAEMSNFHSDRAGRQGLYDINGISKVQNYVVHNPCQIENLFVFGSSTRSSTLMKPTESHLAKRNNLHQVRNAQQSANRLRKLHLEEYAENNEDPSENNVQAFKRQKLDGGNLRKVIAEKQHINLIHKIPEKNNRTSTCKLRLTIPREPDLQTAQRAQRIRILRSNVDIKSQGIMRQVASTISSQSLNRKIIKSSSIHDCHKTTSKLPEFQLKLVERETNHSVAISLSLDVNDCTPSRPTEGVKSNLKYVQHQLSIATISANNDQIKHKDENIIPAFTAKPLNKKTLSSKGDMGVFRCVKQETTKHTVFNLSTNKRCQQDMAAELFNKLSLNSDAQQSSASLTLPVWHFNAPEKDFKRNANYIPPKRNKANYEDQGCSLKNEAFKCHKLEINNLRRHAMR